MKEPLSRTSGAGAGEAAPAAPTIRPARPDEAEALTVLALASKAWWGYPPDFMARCRAELTLMRADLEDHRNSYAVAERDGCAVGFYGLAQLSDGEWELEALFVAPEYIGTGIGRTLLRHARDRAARAGAASILIQGDPHAHEFYIAAGARPLGERESGSIPGRMLPLYRLPVSRADPAA